MAKAKIEIQITFKNYIDKTEVVYKNQQSRKPAKNCALKCCCQKFKIQDSPLNSPRFKLLVSERRNQLEWSI